MAKLEMLDIPAGPVRDLMVELHTLHARAGWPSCRQMSRGLPMSHVTVHVLFTKTTALPKLTVLLDVVEQLSRMARRLDVDETVDRFDQMWTAAAATPSHC